MASLTILVTIVIFYSYTCIHSNLHLTRNLKNYLDMLSQKMRSQIRNTESADMPKIIKTCSLGPKDF